MKHAFAHLAVFLSLGIVVSPANATTDISANKIVIEGLELRDLQCSLKGDAKQVVLAPLGKAVAAHKKALEACDPQGGSYRVGFKWKAGKLRGSKVRKASNRKAKRCVAKTIKAVNPTFEGTCRVTIILTKTAPDPPPAQPKPQTETSEKPPANPKIDQPPQEKPDSKN